MMSEREAMDMAGIGPITAVTYATPSVSYASAQTSSAGVSTQAQVKSEQASVDKAEKPWDKSADTTERVETSQVERTQREDTDRYTGPVHTSISPETLAATRPAEDPRFIKPDDSEPEAEESAGAGLSDEERTEVLRQAAGLSDDAKSAAQAEITQEETSKEAQAVEETSDTGSQAKQITNFTGYTDAQLQQLYQRGDISRYDYETEMDSREEKVDQQINENAQTSQTIAQGAAKSAEADRRSDAIEKAYSDDSSDKLSGQTRADVLNKLDNTIGFGSGQTGRTEQSERVARDSDEQSRNLIRQQNVFSKWQRDFGFLVAS